jgi:hypothetical protein
MPIPPLNGFFILQSVLLDQRHPKWLIWALHGGMMLVFLAFASYLAAVVMLLDHLL